MIDDDRTLDQLLAETAEARARLRAASAADQPPAHLDEAILAASRRAVSARPMAVQRSPWRRWQVPLAAAAVVVLATSVGLLTLQEREHERLLDTVPMASREPPPELEREIRPRVEEPVLAKRMKPSLPEKASGTPDELKAPAIDSRSRLEYLREGLPRMQQRGEPELDSRAPAPAAPPVAAGAASESGQTGAARMEERLERQPDRAPAPAAPAVARAASESNDAGASRSASDAAREDRLPAAAAPHAGPAPEVSAKDAVPEALLPRAKSEATVEARRPAPKQRALNAVADPPAAELEHIRKRWEAGDHSGARDALAAFLRRHPGYRLPPGYPVPPPEAEPAQERPSGDR